VATSQENNLAKFGYMLDILKKEESLYILGYLLKHYHKNLAI
jgi:hypothetical protein